jgi:hypothetical protein
MEYATDQTIEIASAEDDAILPEGWDGESGYLEMQEVEESPTTDDPTLEADTETGEEAGTDVSDVEQSEAAEAEAEEAPTTEQTTPIAAPSPKVRIKYNHEEKELELDEAAQWVQKGFHHDKISPTYEKAATLAKQMGFKTADELLIAAEENFIQQQVQELVDEGVHESVAETVVRAKLGMLKHPEPEPEAEPEVVAQPDPVAQRQAEMDRDIDLFIKAYPGVTQVPDAVLKTCREKGTPLVAAYAKWEAEQAKQELKILKQNQAAAAKAPVGGATTHGSVNTKAQEKDPFTEGFDSDVW